MSTGIPMLDKLLQNDSNDAPETNTSRLSNRQIVFRLNANDFERLQKQLATLCAQHFKTKSSGYYCSLVILNAAGWSEEKHLQRIYYYNETIKPLLKKYGKKGSGSGSVKTKEAKVE